MPRAKEDQRRHTTASALYAQPGNGQCTMCNESHQTSECDKWQELDLDARKAKLRKLGMCFKCMRKGHLAKRCHAAIKCRTCAGAHATPLCDMQPSTSTNVPQQALKTVRVVLDSGAQRSYVSNSLATEIDNGCIGTENMLHALFGGTVTQASAHKSYKICMKAGKYACNFTVLGQATICVGIPAIQQGSWSTELAKMGIEPDDVLEDSPIDVLIGTDVLGRLLTGEVKTLSSGLTAVKTQLGWTLMGKVPTARTDAVNMAIGLLCTNGNIEQLWDLETLGIENPTTALSRKHATQAAREVFMESVRFNNDGRYKVRLPWLLDHPTLPDNKELSERRQGKLMRQLQDKNLMQQYDEVMKTWLRDGIIEHAPVEEAGKMYHYLPHRPVLKEQGTTKIRPVFDASARQKGYPPLNDCLEKGENTLRLIPDVLLGFRQRSVGVTPDIRAAFLQMAAHEVDRDVLRFWWRAGGYLAAFRHCRVVFGVSCSPFLLGATIAHHLALERKEKSHLDDDSERLTRSLYVDNCFTSVGGCEEARRFKDLAKSAIKSAGFDLRGWMFTDADCLDAIDRHVSVLGLQWDRSRDTLSISPSCVRMPRDNVTKRVMLSEVQGVFDPIAFSSPITIKAKIMLQKLWLRKISWDEAVRDGFADEFNEWTAGLPKLTTISIPRHLGHTGAEKATLHVFCDASQWAYAAAIFVRIEATDGVQVRLVVAKSRVAPAEGLSIPRLELMAATIGSRLYASVLFEGTVRSGCSLLERLLDHAGLDKKEGRMGILCWEPRQRDPRTDQR